MDFRYPKDAEKHLLAVKSGLTRSQVFIYYSCLSVALFKGEQSDILAWLCLQTQVSNWFINARVRLWKPMIEEMYAEMNKRKACRNEEGIQNNHGNRISMSNQRFNVN